MAKLLTGTRIYGTATVDTILTVNGTTSATNTFSGALTVAGGVGITGDTWVGGQLYVNGQPVLTGGGGGGGGYVANIVAGTDTAVSSSSGVITIWSTATLQSITSRGSSTNQIITILNATNSISPTSGALQVSGGLGVGSDAYFAGLIVTRSVAQSNNTSTGAIISAGGAGIAGNAYIGGAVWANTGAFVVSKLELRDATTSTINVARLSQTGTTAVLHIGRTDQINQPSINFRSSGSDIDFDTKISSSGGNNVTGNGNLNLYAVTVDLPSTTLASNTYTGALTVSGGVGIAGSTFIGGNLYAQSPTASSAYNNGALVVTGGAGIAGNVYINGNVLSVGNGASTRGITGVKVFSNGTFATAGDAQKSVYVLRRQITGSSYTVLTTDNSTAGSTNQVCLPDNATFAFNILITAKSGTSTDEGAWKFDGVISRYNGASTTILRVSNKTKIWSSVALWDCQVLADATTGALIVQAKGDGANTIRFVATVDTSEVTT
jgi:hypothetical protein